MRSSEDPISVKNLKRVRDMREYIRLLSQIGEIQPINEPVSLHEEVGAIIRNSYELRAPAPLFRKLKETSNRFSLLGAPAGVSAQRGLELSRIAISLGLPPNSNGRQVVEAIAAAHERGLLPTHEVTTAPCKENVQRAEEVDLLQFPTPLLHGGDGCRYINTYGCIVVQTPDREWTNWSIARIMLVDRNRMTGIVKVGQHLGDIHKMWADQGKDCPFALALGVEPAIPFVCGMPLSSGVDEGAFLGGYFGEPIEVVRCESNEMSAPASAEVIIEGYISRSETHGARSL
jgi:UbiD family decarboxylase